MATSESDTLTELERKVLILLIQGHTVPEIAGRLRQRDSRIVTVRDQAIWKVFWARGREAGITRAAASPASAPAGESNPVE